VFIQRFLHNLSEEALKQEEKTKIDELLRLFIKLSHYLGLPAEVCFSFLIAFHQFSFLCFSRCVSLRVVCGIMPLFF